MSVKRVNVLLTGAGGNQAVFIWKALRQGSIPVRIVATDCKPLAVGLYRAERSYLVPRADSSQYLAEMMALFKKEQIDIVMVGDMAEQRMLAHHAEVIRAETGAFVVSSPPEILAKAEDKWDLVQFLAANGFDYPRSVLPTDHEALNRFLAEVPFPYIVKSRLGAGSQGLAVARNADELSFFIRSVPGPVIQEYLLPDDEEYTVGCFMNSKGGAVGSIVMRRKLGMGLTNRAEVVESELISQVCEDIAARIGLVGPCNLQLRLTSRGPVLFEINPRFSSTESARAYYNFNAPEMCIRHYVFGEELERPAVRKGVFFRVLDDVFVDKEQVSTLEREGYLEGPSGVMLQSF